MIALRLLVISGTESNKRETDRQRLEKERKKEKQKDRQTEAENDMDRDNQREKKGEMYLYIRFDKCNLNSYRELRGGGEVKAWTLKKKNLCEA